MTTTLVLRAPQALTAPLPGTPKLRLAGDVFTLTSDSFDGADATTLAGRSTDAALGGSPLPYALTVATAWGITAGALTVGSAPQTSLATTTLPSTRSKDVTASVKVLALPAGGASSVYLITRRDTSGSPQSQVRLGFNVNSVTLNTYTGGVSTTATDPLTIAAGDVIGLREYDGLVQILKNGTVARTYQFAAGQFTGNLAGFACTASAAGFKFDNFLVTETIR